MKHLLITDAEYKARSFLGGLHAYARDALCHMPQKEAAKFFDLYQSKLSNVERGQCDFPALCVLLIIREIFLEPSLCSLYAPKLRELLSSLPDPSTVSPHEILEGEIMKLPNGKKVRLLDGKLLPVEGDSQDPPQADPQGHS